MAVSNRIRLAILCSTVCSQTVWAAAPGAEPLITIVPAAADESPGDIVVTARKKAEFQRDVPISVETFSGAQLSAAKITQIIDLTTRVPALTISYGQVSPFLEIRGFGTGNNISFDQAVGKFIDNVSFSRDNDIRLPLFDLERVEVLKGPQVLLYGNSSTAGALNITTRKPGNELEADGSVDYEFNNHEVITQGGVTIPLGKSASLRVSGIYQNLDKGPTFNTFTGDYGPKTKNYAVRGILRLMPAPDLSILLKAEYDHLRDTGVSQEPVAQPIGLNFYPETQLNGVIDTGVNTAPFFDKPFNAVNNETYQGDVNYTALGGIFISTTAYRKLRYAGSTPNPDVYPIFNGLQSYNYRQFSQELRYSGSFGRLDFTAGGFYQHESLSIASPVDTNLGAVGFPLPPFAFDFRLDEKTDSYSGFADLTFHITPSLSVEAGARYSEITRHAVQSVFANAIIPNKTFDLPPSALQRDPAFDALFGVFFFGSLPHSYSNLVSDESHLQPQVVLQYKFADKNQVYAKYVKGDKAGGFDTNYSGEPGNISPAGAHFAPEKAVSYEIGVKGLVLDNKLNYSVDLFNTDFSNLQTSAYVGAATVTVVTNVGRARTRGVEAELDYAPAQGLSLRIAANYIDAKYLSFPGGACTRAQTALLPPFAPCTQDLSNTPTPFSSKFSGSIGIDYERPIGKLIVGGGTTFTGRTDYNVSTNNEPLLQQNGYVLIDAHFDLKPASGPWSVSAFGRNLSGVQFKQFGGLVPGLNGSLASSISRGRQIGIRTAVRF